MYTKSFLFVINSLFVINMFGQCPPTPIFLSTQAEVTAFVTNYPNCTYLQGDLTISGTEITDLSGMSIDTIDGNFTIRLTGLASFIDLNKLERVAGNFGIVSNFSLVDFTGLDQLKFIGGDFSLNSNFINSYNGLQGLDTIVGSLKIVGSSFAPDLSGLDNLSYLVDDLKIERSEFQTLDGIQSLEEINGDLVLFDNIIHISLFGLEKIRKVGGLVNLQLLRGQALDDLSGLNNLQEIGGDMTITQSSFIHLSGLERLKTINGGFYIGFDSRLLDFVGLDSLTAIGTDFAVSFNSSQTSFDGILQLNSIGGDFQIGGPFFDAEGMEVLTDVSSLDHPIQIGGELLIENCPLLTDCAKDAICSHLNLNNPADIDLNGTGCNSVQEVVNACGPVTIEGANGKQDLMVFPNPSYGNLFIKQESKLYSKVTVYLSNGQKVAQYALTDEVSSIDFPGHADGLIILAFHSNMATIYQKHLLVR